MFERCESCPIAELCLYNRRPQDTCADMVSKYNAGLLLPVEAFEKSSMQ